MDTKPISGKKMVEKYSTTSIVDLEKKVEQQLLPASFRICNRIEQLGRKELRLRMKQFASSNCPIRRCTVLMGIPQKCPNPLCWIAEGPTWREFLLPEIDVIYSMLTDTYLEALNIPDNPDEPVTPKESPLSVMDRKLKTEMSRALIVESFEKSEILKPRASLIKDIMWAHGKRKYSLSIPALIILIEGILHDLAFHFQWKFEKEEMYRDESAKVWAIIEKLDDKPFEKALTNFYKRTETSSDSPRNLIVHGRSIDYIENCKLSTVLFLILIYLVAFSQMKLHGRVSLE